MGPHTRLRYVGRIHPGARNSHGHSLWTTSSTKLPSVRAVLGIRGEPGQPPVPSEGQVWQSIMTMVDEPGSENEFVSVADAERTRFSTHPWSLQGGEAARLKDRLESEASQVLDRRSRLIGYTGQTNADPVFIRPRAASLRSGVPGHLLRDLVIGEVIRDWQISPGDAALFPYDLNEAALVDIGREPGLLRNMWPYKATLGGRRTFSKMSYFEEGRPWWEWHQVALDRVPGFSITFAFVATHNHFVLDRGGKVFNRSAPVIKLPDAATEEDHLRLLGLLNSSTACFWMKQVFYPKGGDPVGQEGARLSQAAWSDRFEHDGTKLKQFPIPSVTPLERSRDLDTLAQALEATLPAQLLRSQPPTRATLEAARNEGASLRARMVALQEELDWECYYLYGLIDRPMALRTDELPKLERGQRAFEIALARDMAAGRVNSTWFERHGTTPTTEIPGHWPAAYREAVEDRIALIRSDRKIRLLERPEYKRRWNWESWDELEKSALRSWLLDRIERLPLWESPELQTVARVADVLRRDAEVVEAAALLVGTGGAELDALVESLVADESVPYLAALRLRPSGLLKRRAWETTWTLQRMEDELEARAALPDGDPKRLTPGALAEAHKEAGVDRIPIPPKYASTDFVRSSWWSHRGKLDVPKERFMSVPGTRVGSDASSVFGWAGWNHVERAQALASHFSLRKAGGAVAGELVPLLAGVAELVPWLLQWHNDLDPTFGARMGEFFRGFMDQEARALGLTVDELRSWTPD
jgi:hypothetical protein